MKANLPLIAMLGSEVAKSQNAVAFQLLLTEEESSTRETINRLSHEAADPYPIRGNMDDDTFSSAVSAWADRAVKTRSKKRADAVDQLACAVRHLDVIAHVRALHLSSETPEAKRLVVNAVTLGTALGWYRWRKPEGRPRGSLRSSSLEELELIETLRKEGMSGVEAARTVKGVPKHASPKSVYDYAAASAKRRKKSR